MHLVRRESNSDDGVRFSRYFLQEFKIKTKIVFTHYTSDIGHVETICLDKLFSK